MASRLRASFTPGTALLAVALLTVGTHTLLATVFVPVHSDVFVYERYAASVAGGIRDGTSLAVARDRIIREAAQRQGLPAPTTEQLLVEYPPVAVVAMATLGIGLDFSDGTSSGAYEPRYRLALLAIDLLVVLVLIAWASRGFVTATVGNRLSAWRLALYGLAGLILGNLLFDRLDLVIGALLLVGVLLLVRGSWLASFLVLAVAINFKASPVALAPLWVVASLPPELFTLARTRPMALVKAFAARSLALAGLTALVFLPFLVTEGARALDFLRFRALQGIHIESVPGSILQVLHLVGMPLEVTKSFGTFELQTPATSAFAVASPLLLVIAAASTLALYARVPASGPGQRAQTSRSGDLAVSAGGRTLASIDPPRFLCATVATLLLTLVTSKLLSPQYLIWLLPLVPLLDIGPARTRAFELGFLFACAVTTAIFPYLLGRTLARQDPASDGYLDPTPLGVGLLLVRNVLLVWLAWRAVRPLFRTPMADADRQLPS
jgi:hypothetical protein